MSKIMIYFPRPFTLTKQKYTSQTSQKKKFNKTKRRPLRLVYSIMADFTSNIINMAEFETGRRLGDRFWEHLRDVERNDKDASNQSLGNLISLTILNNIGFKE